MFEKYTLIDLTHSLNSKIPTWNDSCGFTLDEEDKITTYTSSGTHIDAPSYFAAKSHSIDTLPLEQLLAPACVIDVSKKTSPSYQISPQDVLEYETTHGPIPKNSLVIAYTGWDRYWTDPKAYRNADAKGQMHFPTFGIETLELLLTRKIAGVAIDTLALESLSSASFPGHRLLFEANKYIIENIANVSKLPPKGAFVIALPLKIEKGAEAPARVIGLIPK